MLGALACGPAPMRRPVSHKSRAVCEDTTVSVAAARTLLKEGQLDRSLAELSEVRPPCSRRVELLALRLQLLLELDDVEAAQKVARQLLQRPTDDVARLANAAMSREPVRDSLGAVRTLWQQAEEAKRGGDTTAMSRLLDRSLHALERLAGERAVLDAFFGRSAGDWGGGIGYQRATSIHNGEAYTLMLRVGAATEAAVEPRFAFRGGESHVTAFARSGERIVVGGDGELSLFQGMNAPAQRLGGTWARFSPAGDQLVVVGDREVLVVDAFTATTLSRMAIKSGIAGFDTRSVWLTDTRLFMSGHCAQEAEAVCTLVVDITAARALVDRSARRAELSPSKRYVALMESQANGANFPSGVLTVWDHQTLQWSQGVNVGSLYPAPKEIQFGPNERRVIVFASGQRGLNTYEGRKVVAAVDIATGNKAPPPPWNEVRPADDTERWSALAPSLKALATVPRALVPTQRGPGRSRGFVETSDGRTIAVLDGLVARAFAGVSTREPHILIVDSGTRKLRKRIILPVDPSQTFITAILGLMPDEHTLHLCLDGESPHSFLVDMPSSTVTTIGLGCYDAVVSEDGSALYGELAVVDLATKRTHPIPFVTTVALLHAAGTDAGRNQIQALAPSLVFCRAGGFLAPGAVCRARRRQHHGREIGEGIRRRMPGGSRLATGDERGAPGLQ